MGVVKTSLLLLLLLVTIQSQAMVRVAFFEGYHHDGRRAELSPGDRFFHTAIEIEGVWYEASAPYGVRSIKSLKHDKTLKLIEILSSPMVRLSKKDIKPYLRLPFDYNYRWFDKRSSYCSKLVANLLNIEPTPASFEGPHWDRADKRKFSSLAISPDELNFELKKRGFISSLESSKKALSCGAVL